MRARALLIEALVGIISAAVAAGAFLWMAKYTVLKEADMISLTWSLRKNHRTEASCIFGMKTS